MHVQETQQETPELVKTLATIHAEATRALEMLTLAQRSPARSKVSGRSALTAIKNMAGDRLDSQSYVPERTGTG